MQVVADDLDVGPLLRELFLGHARDLLAVRIVLVDQEDVLHLRPALDVGRQCFHLHVGVGVEAEVPEAALAVGEVGIDRRVVQEDDRLRRVALVVLLDRVDQRQRRARPIALRHVADSLVDRLLQHRQRLLRRSLVVERHDLEPDAGTRQLLGVDQFGHELEVPQQVRADTGERAGQRIDEGDLHGLCSDRRGGRGSLALRERARCGKRHRGCSEPRNRLTSNHVASPVVSPFMRRSGRENTGGPAHGKAAVRSGAHVLLMRSAAGSPRTARAAGS